MRGFDNTIGTNFTKENLQNTMRVIRNNSCYILYEIIKAVFLPGFL